MKVSKLIDKLINIQAKYEDIEVGHMVRHGYNRVTTKAQVVEVTVKQPRTSPKVVIETYGENE